MAKMASAGVYSNGLSLHAIPEMVLRRDLENAHTELSLELLRRATAGEFEATEVRGRGLNQITVALAAAGNATRI